MGGAQPDNWSRITLKRAGLGLTLVSVALQSVPLPRTGPGSAKTACCGPLWVQTGKIGQVLPECPLLEDPVLRKVWVWFTQCGVDWGAPGRVTFKEGGYCQASRGACEADRLISSELRWKISVLFRPRSPNTRSWCLLERLWWLSGRSPAWHKFLNLNLIVYI